MKFFDECNKVELHYLSLPLKSLAGVKKFWDKKAGKMHRHQTYRMMILWLG
jgi:hypothetical protein